MPEFQKKQQRFIHRGMCWNRPVDAIPEEQIVFGLNIRATQNGTITQRPGLTSFIDLTAGVAGSFLTSIATLNNFNTGLVAFTKVYIFTTNSGGGSTGKLFVGDTAANLATANNPVKLPPSGSTTGLSGNPVTMVDMAPLGTNIGWKYIGDKNLNFSVGYYPGDTTVNATGNNGGMARAITMGMTPPVNTTVPTVVAGGLLTGSYQWIFAYRNKFTGARSNPSAPTRVTLAAPGLVCAAQKGSMVLPATPNDPQNTGFADPNVVIDIYRFGGTINDWRYVGTDTSGATFIDNLADSAILTAPTPPEVTDPVTGATRFNLFRPFVYQDNAVYSINNGTVSVEGKGTYIITAASGAGDPLFNLNWLPGSAISINFNTWTIFQVRSTTVIEIVEDGAGNIPAGTYPWATLTGTLTAGGAMPHIWGPYGTGQGGAFIFGCGGANFDAGTLYWTNGNDPDSTDIVNSLLVTSPSEPLRGGCVYDGTPFVWSSERMFRIYPGNIPGQFTVQEIPGSKGLWAEYSLTVQSNGISDQSVSWVSRDGIYDWSSSNGLTCLTDRDLYPFFPHDNQSGIDLGTIFDFFVQGATTPINAPSYLAANMKYHRLCWFMGELFYDYVCVRGGSTKVYNTLVFDPKETGGWVSVDQYSNGGAVCVNPVCRGIEIATSSVVSTNVLSGMKVGVGPIVCDYTGTDDATSAISCRVITRQDNLGDARAQKLYGDYMFDAAAGNVSGGLAVSPLVSLGLTQLANQTITNATRTQNVYTLSSSGLGSLGTTFGFDIQWTAGTSPATLYQYEYAYVPKPELTGKRATDKTDDGYNGAKYLRGLCIESNTTTARTVKVLVDDVLAATLTVDTGNSQLELPFALTPVVGSEFQFQPTDASTWELFQVRWVWEKWPDLTIIQSNWLDLGSSKPKYIRGFQIPVSGPAAPLLSFTATYDGASTQGTVGVAPVSLTAKSPAYFAFLPPLVAHQIKLIPSTPCRVFYEGLVWDAEEWPELAQLFGPVEKLGDSGAKYLRGFELPIETNTNNVVMELRYDSQPTATTGTSLTEAFPAVSTTALSKNVFPFNPAAPIIAHEFQLLSDSPARFWYQEVKWDFEPWPEFDTGRSPWMDGGTPGAKWVKGLVIPLDTGGFPVFLDLVYDGGTVVLGPFTTTPSQKNTVAWAFTVPLILHEFQITPRTSARVWYEEIKWDMEPWPELISESSFWANAGTPSAKFMQGLVIPMDTSGVAVTYDLFYDGGSVVVGPFTTQAGRRTPVAFSFPVPFIAHELLLTPRTPCRTWYEEIKWVWEPLPELVTTYSTQATDFDLPGYHYLFDAYIAYIGTGTAPTLAITTDYGTLTYNLPVSNGVYTRAYLLLNPQKAKWRSFHITSSTGLRLYLKDCEVRVKNWTDKGQYPSSFQSHHPFGDESRISGAKI